MIKSACIRVYPRLIKSRAARLVSEDSRELFQTIQKGSPSAENKRRAFIEKLIELENTMSE